MANMIFRVMEVGRDNRSLETQLTNDNKPVELVRQINAQGRAFLLKYPSRDKMLVFKDVISEVINRIKARTRDLPGTSRVKTLMDVKLKLLLEYRQLGNLE